MATKKAPSRTRSKDTLQTELERVRVAITSREEMDPITAKEEAARKSALVEQLGTVTATKLDRYTLRMTVTVRPRGASQLLVRANAQYQLEAVDDPEPYQRFFAALAKAMFLEAQHVE